MLRKNHPNAQHAMFEASSRHNPSSARANVNRSSKSSVRPDHRQSEAQEDRHDERFNNTDGPL